ncbi:FUSC family membrane protein [Shigella flexneri]
MWRRLIYHPDINYALRQTLVLCLPVAVGLMLGELRFGLLFSLVPACCNIAGLDTPHKRFFKHLIIGASLFATCSLLTQLLLVKDVPLPFLLTGLTLVLGVTAELGPLHAKLLPASLLAAIFTLSLAGYMPVWEPLLIYALGTLWYGLFNWFWFWIWREQPLRESLSLLYRELADYCEAKYSLLTQHTDPEKALPPLLVRQQKAVDLITQCYQQMHTAFRAKQYRLQADAAYFQEALDLQEHISSVCISRKRCKNWSSVAMRKKLSAGMRKPSPLACACWLMTFLPSPANAFYDGKANWRTGKNRPPASG